MLRIIWDEQAVQLQQKFKDLQYRNQLGAMLEDQLTEPGAAITDSPVDPRTRLLDTGGGAAKADSQVDPRTRLIQAEEKYVEDLFVQNGRFES